MTATAERRPSFFVIAVTAIRPFGVSTTTVPLKTVPASEGIISSINAEVWACGPSWNEVVLVVVPSSLLSVRRKVIGFVVVFATAIPVDEVAFTSTGRR